MRTYIRPDIAETTYRDDSGAVIPYGNRWGDAGPPDDTYSVDTHPERFEPLHRVAEAVIRFVIANYDVEVAQGAAATAGLLHAPDAKDIVRASRFTPSSPLAAPVTIVLTSYPTVHLYAGVFFHSVYPSCGCDACDEVWGPEAERLESETFAIVGGGLSERDTGPRRRKLSIDWGKGMTLGMGRALSYKLDMLDDGSSSGGETSTDGLSEVFLRTAADQLHTLASASPTGTWHPWAPRTT